MTHDEIKDLLGKTTEGEWEPWEDHSYEEYYCPWVGCGHIHIPIIEYERPKDEQQEKENDKSWKQALADAAFIAKSKDIVRQLLGENERLKSVIESMANQFAYDDDGRTELTTGGLSDLERAFEILGWDDPHKL